MTQTKEADLDRMVFDCSQDSKKLEYKVLHISFPNQHEIKGRGKGVANS